MSSHTTPSPSSLRSLLYEVREWLKGEQALGVETLTVDRQPSAVGRQGAGGREQETGKSRSRGVEESAVNRPEVQKSRSPGVQESNRRLSTVDRQPSTVNGERGTTSSWVTGGGVEKREAFDLLARKIRGCQQCPLHQSRTQAVPGEGNLEAKILFIGEAPGADEDAQGRPFVGRAGKLLDECLREAGLERRDVFIANVLKCRPPGNREPQPVEIGSCYPYLTALIHLIQPRLLCALGRISSQVLTNSPLPMGTLRGKILPWNNAYPVLSTYHPAYILRNPSERYKLVDDLKRAYETVK